MPECELRPGEVEVEDLSGRLYRVLLQGHGVHLVRKRVVVGSAVRWRRVHCCTLAWYRSVDLARNKLAEN